MVIVQSKANRLANIRLGKFNRALASRSLKHSLEPPKAIFQRFRESNHF